MITRQSDKSLKQSRNFDSHSFGIKESGLSHIFNVLRNQLYSDKVLAVIREYSTNAVDAHIEAGKRDVPIKVTLPNQLKADFKIRDFGRGLTEKQISDVYAMYGESTKRGSNEQIGQLGLGCKSAFAYGDNFIINSFVGGIKTTYNAFIDPSDIGQISKMEEKKTSEKDGIEIVIPVKSEDVEEFHTKAFKLYKFFEVVPEIHGADKEEVSRETERSKVIVSKDNWKLVDGGSYAVMGNIAYPIDEHALNIDWNSTSHELLNSGVEIVFDIGDLEISASREALQYTDRTKTAITNILNVILDSLPSVLGKKFEECKSLWDAKILYNEAFAHGGFGGKIKKVVDSKGIVWNGTTIKNGTFDTSKWKDEDLEVKVFTKPHTYNSSKRVKGNETNNILCRGDALVIIDDAPTHHGRLNRIAPLIETYDKQTSDKKYKSVYLINYRNGQAKKDFLDSQKLDFETKKLSEYPKVILRDIYPSNATVSGGSSLVKNTKHSTKVFSLDKDCSKGKWHNCRSDFFESETVDLDKDKGVYVFVRKFFYGKCDISAEENHPAKLVQSVKELKSLGIDVPTVYAFKVTEKTEKAIEGDNWTYFEDWARKEFQKKMKEENVEQELLDSLAAKVHEKNISRLDDFCEAFVEFDKKSDNFRGSLPEGSTARNYITKFYEMMGENLKDMKKDEHGDVEGFLVDYERALKMFRSPSGEDANNWNTHGEPRKVHRRGFFKDMQPTHDLNKLCKDCMTRYPMITYMDNHHFNYQFTEESVKETINYVTLVEATYNIKKNIQKQKQRIEDNIFSVAEKS